MQRTIFETPLINRLMLGVSRFAMRSTGWRTEGMSPDEIAAYPKYVLIAAPHTSNWDFPITLMLCFQLRLRVYWMAKASLFSWPIGWLSRWLGGIPIDRSASNNTVQTTIKAFQERERLAVIVAPEGTRGKVTHWKTGFYHMAHGAGVPIAMAYLDYARKRGGIGRMFVTTGDITADMAEIQQFYSGISGKHRDKFDASTVRRR
ncbi:lysophospholipid acyltransferase family protein [Massilia sp. PAMC28688]|uniref:lysophospholipid acyltransferase family protein n=1 Tax=Massilia sp. PAMC28688 TaxID=2861283 RepID=UPI001C62BCB2|nr:lysophospholipid acyltransferase family protein [Massilia sp. PAMC28688]QYF94166.1 lysophospholipid acyltransferase family protein [Massilia sp. PAMC28688]